MTKIKLESLTKEELEQKSEQLKNEINTLKNVIEASNTTVFDLLIGEVKKEMEDNIAEEEWKKLKENQKKIESYRSIEKTLQNQEDLLERKQEELEDIQSAIDCYQPSLFEETESSKLINIGGESLKTGFEDSNGNEYKTGDIYKSEDEHGCQEFYLIKQSAEVSDKFSMISNAFEGELLLNYPKNREILKCADFIGNIYNENNTNEALEALEVIADSQQINNESEPSAEENTDS